MDAGGVEMIGCCECAYWLAGINGTGICVRSVQREMDKMGVVDARDISMAALRSMRAPSDACGEAVRMPNGRTEC